MDELIAFGSTIDPWYKRVANFGHGKFTAMTPDQAIHVAKESEPNEPDGWSAEAQNVGLRRGDWVRVTPDDYGNWVYGRLLAWTAEEIVIRHGCKRMGGG